jgi:hypothetical protein
MGVAESKFKTVAAAAAAASGERRAAALCGPCTWAGRTSESSAWLVRDHDGDDAIFSPLFPCTKLLPIYTYASINFRAGGLFFERVADSASLSSAWGPLRQFYKLGARTRNLSRIFWSTPR